MQAFTAEQLNFFKLTALVVDEFPVALRKVFVLMWDHWYANKPGVPNWDNSKRVRDVLIEKEGGAGEVPMLKKSLDEWDCTALFRATLYAQTFAVKDKTGAFFTLDEYYVKPCRLRYGEFHPDVVRQDFKESVSLALNQVRVLRNNLFHSLSTKYVNKETFERYIKLARDAFTALKQDTAKIDEIGNLGEDNFPTSKQKRLEDELEKEKDAAIKHKQIEDHLNKIEGQVTKVKTEVADVKSEVTGVKTEVTDVKSEVRGVKTKVTDVKSEVRGVKSEVSNVKTEVTGVKTEVSNVKTKVTDVKTEVTGVKSEVRGVKSEVSNVKSEVIGVKTEVTDVKTEVTDVKTEVTDVKSEVTDVKSEVIGVKSEVTGVKSEVTGVKTEVTDVKTEVSNVKSEVTGVKSEVTGVKSEVSNVKTEVTGVKSEVIGVKTEVTDVKSEVTDVKKGVENLQSDVRELTTEVVHVKKALQKESSNGPPFPKSCIPDKIPHFVGRKGECQNILNQLTNRSTRLVDIWGPPGFGKTSVSIQVAHELREKKIPVYFTSLRGLKTRDDLVSKLLCIFVDATEAFYVSPSDWLIQCLQKWQSPFVLILDNADDLLESGDTKVKEDVLRFIEELQDKCNHISLVITSRESLEDLSYKLSIHLEKISVLDEASSGKLVRTLLSKVSESDCNCILKECGRVPLAMRLMCSTITEENVSVSELSEELKNSPLVEVLDNESFTSDARLKTIINTSFQRLTPLQRDAFVALAVFPSRFGKDEARAVLNLKNVFQARKILRSLKRKSLVDSSDDFENFTIHSLLRSFIEERRRAEDEIQKHFAAAQLRFYDYHISKFREANEKFLTGSSNDAFEAFYSQRENIRLAIVNGSKDDDLYSKVVEALSKAELFVYAALPCQEPLLDILYSTPIEEAKKRQHRDDECKLLAAKSFSLLGGFYSRPRSWDHSLKGGDENAENPPAKYLVYLGIHQLLCRNIDDGISSLRASVDRLGSDNDERILKILACHVLAVCYRKKMDKEKASKYETLCVKECELSSCCPAFLDLFLPNNDNDATSVIEKDVFFFAVLAELLPLLYKKLEFDHQTVTELPLMTRHLKRFQNVILELFDKGILRDRVLEACCNALFNLKCYREAAEGFQRITDKLEALGSRSKNASETYFILGLAFEQLKNFKEAFHYYEKSVAIKMELLNRTLPEGTHDIEEIDDFLWTLSSCFKTQYFCNATAVGHPDSLKATFEELKTIVQSESLNVCSKNHDEISSLCKMFADCQFWMKDFAGALESYQQAIALTEEHDSDQVKLAVCLFSKGTTHFEMENYTEAIKACQSALNLGSLGDQDTANIYYKLGFSYFALNDFNKALDGHQQALKLRKIHLDDHELTATSLKEIGVVHFRMGEYDAAIEKFQNAVDLMTTLFKGDREETARVLFDLGESYFAVGKYKEAYDSCKKALSIRQNLLGEHKDTAATFHSLGEICSKMNDFKGAVRYFRRASEFRVNLLGDHLETALSHHCLGEAQIHKGGTVDALDSLHAALNIRENTLGFHLDTAATCELLGRVYGDLEQHDSAFRLFYSRT